VGGRSWGREKPRSRTGWEFPRAPPQATRVWPRASSNRARSTDHSGFLTPPRRYHPRGHLPPPMGSGGQPLRALPPGGATTGEGGGPPWALHPRPASLNGTSPPPRP
jgi:hypothetical protein